MHTSVLDLQRSVGNVAVARLLGRVAAPTAIDLDAHEGAGGHTIERHVGKSAEFIRGRVIDQQLDAASTFTARDEATRVVGAAVDANQAAINAILFAPQAGERNRAFRYDAGASIGRYLEERSVVDRRGRERKQRGLKTGATTATLVVRMIWNPAPPHQWYVLTCFPNPPR